MAAKQNRIRLRPCPLCGTDAHVTALKHPSGLATYNVSCGVRNDGSDTCGLVLFGGKDGRKSMVEKWNRRQVSAAALC